MAKFVNPYNFIPIGSKKSGNAGKGELSGLIHYSVLTKTPLFIPNTSCDVTFETSLEEKEHISYDFYSYHNQAPVEKGKKVPCYQPVIPGSEIRGMFRSNFEILTSSCLSSLDSDMLLSKRTMESFLPGLIYRDPRTGTYTLYAAEDVLWRTEGENNPRTKRNWDAENDYSLKCYRQKDFKEGEKVCFKKYSRKQGKPLAEYVRKYEANADGFVGYIIKGEDGPQMKHSRDKNTGKIRRLSTQKHCCHIFTLPGKEKVIEKVLSLETLEDVLKEYERNKKSLYTEYADELEAFKKRKGNDYFPVYYSLIADKGEKRIFLSPACKTREIYVNTLKSLAGDMAPCQDPQNLCAACSLFGTLIRKSAVASRLRFSDLQAEKKSQMEEYYYQNGEPVTLPELAAPKLNNMEFYVKRPDHAWFWTYDYYVDPQGKVHIQQGELAGRKFYWHHLIEKVPEAGELTKRNRTVRPVREGCQFKGKIYFDHLTERELNQLIYTVNAGEDGELTKKQHGYKLGAAKPFGLGSIATQVDSVILRSYATEDGTIAVKEIPYTAKDPVQYVDQNQVDYFEKMTNFTSVAGENVTYPYSKERSESGYEWYTANHAKYDRIKKKIANMPNMRTEMIYKEYMEPMNPYVQPVDQKFVDDKQNVPTDRNKKSFSGNEKGNRETGKIKMIGSHYGFIKVDNSAEDLYFSKYECSEFLKLKVGSEVSFVKGKNKVKDCAIRVSLVKKN